MCKTTSCHITMASIQALFAFLLIPGYIICTAASSNLLWQEFFYTSTGICHKSEKACAISNSIYSTINCLVCIASMITSIMMAISFSNINGTPSVRTKKILTWLIVQMIFIFHHIVLHIFTILSIEITSRSRSDFAALGVAMSTVVLIPFTISMLTSLSFIFPMFSYYRWLKEVTEKEKENARMATPIQLLPMETNILYQY